MSIRVTISDDISEATAIMKRPINNDIFEYTAIVCDALAGLSFSKETIYNGVKEWCINYEKSLPSND